MTIGLTASTPVAAPVTTTQPPTGAQATHRGHHHHHGAAAAADSTSSTTGIFGSSLTEDQQSTLDALSNLLGTDPSTVMAGLQSGTSLSSMLSNSGVSQDDVASVLQNGLMFDASA